MSRVKADKLELLFSRLMSDKAMAENLVAAFQERFADEQARLDKVARNALLNPDDRAVGCVAYGRVELLSEILSYLVAIDVRNQKRSG